MGRTERQLRVNHSEQTVPISNDEPCCLHRLPIRQRTCPTERQARTQPQAQATLPKAWCPCFKVQATAHFGQMDCRTPTRSDARWTNDFSSSSRTSTHHLKTASFATSERYGFAKTHRTSSMRTCRTMKACWRRCLYCHCRQKARKQAQRHSCRISPDQNRNVADLTRVDASQDQQHAKKDVKTLIDTKLPTENPNCAKKNICTALCKMIA